MIRKLVCRLLLIISVISTISGVCAITGGSTATSEEVPYFVNIVDTSFAGSHVCGGVIYDEKTVITSCDCVKTEDVSNPSYLEAIAGAHSGTDGDDFMQRIALQKIVLHEDFDSFSNENDIALLKLAKPFNFSTAQVQKIDLPSEGEVPSGKCVVSGVGKVGNDLASAELSVIPYSTCVMIYETIPTTVVCAGDSVAAFCNGDEGGPFVCTQSDHEFLGGIASWGYGCQSPTYPSVFTDISQFENWILNNL